MSELYGAWRRLEATVQEQQRQLFAAVQVRGTQHGDGTLKEHAACARVCSTRGPRP